MSAPLEGVAPLDRRLAWGMTLGAAALFVTAAWLLLPWETPSVDTASVSAGDYFTEAQLRAAEDYAGVVRPLSWISYGVSLLLAALLGLTRFGSRLVRTIERKRWWLTVPLAILVLLALGRLATLPFALRIREERLRVGLTEQSLAAWFADRGTSLLVAWVMTSLVLLVVVGLARWSPRRWFAWAGAVVVGLVFAGSFLYPVAVEPLFNRFDPMAEGELRTQILALAREEGVEVDEVLVADASRRTTTLNAYVSGLGESRRVVVYDNLLGQPQDQVLTVVAHELAHVRHGDVLVGTTLGAVGGLLAVSSGALLLGSRRLRARAGVTGAADPRAVPLMLALFALAGLVVSPVENGISRGIEVRADRTALQATDDPGTFVELQRQLALQSLADPAPPRWSHVWFGSHPTVLQRIAFAREMEEKQ